MKVRLLSFICFIFCFSIFQQVIAQEVNVKKLDSLFILLDTHQKFMGSVSLFREGQLVYSNAVGYVDTINGRKATTDTRYRIGSITKTFTSVLVLQSVERGKLRLEDTLSKWFPQIKNASQITIRQMLCHRSGIVNFTNSPDYLQWNTKAQAKDSILARIVQGGSSFEPGKKFEYSNSAYFLLGLILEKVNKTTYAKLLSKRIIRPLNLTQTYYGGPIDITANECRSFVKDSVWRISGETDMSVPFAAGALVSTPSDICLFASALFEGRLLSKGSLKEMETLKENVGLGLFRFPFYGKAGYGHTGGIDGFQTVFTYFPDEKVSYALFSNASDFNNNDISISILKSVYGQDFSLPDFSIQSIDAADLANYLGVYANPRLPIKLTFTNNKGRLTSQATGQMAFELDPSGVHTFRQDKYGIVIEFMPDKKQLTLRQGGQSFLFTKEE